MHQLHIISLFLITLAWAQLLWKIKYTWLVFCTRGLYVAVHRQTLLPLYERPLDNTLLHDVFSLICASFGLHWLLLSGSRDKLQRHMSKGYHSLLKKIHIHFATTTTTYAYNKWDFLMTYSLKFPATFLNLPWFSFAFLRLINYWSLSFLWSRQVTFFLITIHLYTIFCKTFMNTCSYIWLQMRFQ